MTLEWLLGWWNLVFVAPFFVALLYLGVYTLTGVGGGDADADAEADADADVDSMDARSATPATYDGAGQLASTRRCSAL